MRRVREELVTIFLRRLRSGFSVLKSFEIKILTSSHNYIAISLVLDVSDFKIWKKCFLYSLYSQEVHGLNHVFKITPGRREACLIYSSFLWLLQLRK